mgnify:CR=1 FL=1
MRKRTDGREREKIEGRRRKRWGVAATVAAGGGDGLRKKGLIKVKNIYTCIERDDYDDDDDGNNILKIRRKGLGRKNLIQDQ